ncbi:MAG: hypothetical protein HYS22_04595 [Deltaproteobacteria bacterium]|nr:hypothetical protein [Deltaproteobacteria bacterium]
MIALFFLLVSPLVRAGDPAADEKFLRLKTPEALAVRKKAEEEWQRTATLKGDEALIQKARALDILTPYFYEEADAKCYRYQRRLSATPACFEKEVKGLNEKYGSGSFEYLGDQILIQYTGLHYRQLLEQYPKSRYQDEASFRLLRGGELINNDPEVVFAKVDNWLKKYPKSPLAPQAWLLLGRLYADGWYLFKTRTFVAIGMQVDDQALDDMAMRYKGKGLWAFKQVMNLFPQSKEAVVAKKEYDLLVHDQNDGVFYGLSY